MNEYLSSGSDSKLQLLLPIIAICAIISIVLLNKHDRAIMSQEIKLKAKYRVGDIVCTRIGNTQGIIIDREKVYNPFNGQIEYTIKTYNNSSPIESDVDEYELCNCK
jgi:preprotein translocase subunit YajC